MSNVYLIPGLGADERVFQNLKLPWKTVGIHWIKPLDKESLSDYAHRLSEQITAPSPILIGVSFGGMIAVELNQYVNAEKVILISSAKKAGDLPRILKGLGNIGLMKLIPTKAFTWPNALLFFLFGAKSKSDKQLLREILRDTDPQFIKWALSAMAGWEYREDHPNVISIHGNNDKLIPNSSADYIINSGGHLMIVNQSDQISKIIIDVCDQQITPPDTKI